MRETVIVFEHGEAWRVAVLLAVVALAWALGYLGLRGKLSRGRRAWLLGLRGASLTALAFLILGPAVEMRQLKALSSRLVFLLDQSRSMALPTKDGDSRAERVDAFLDNQAAELRELSRRFDLEMRGFDLRPAPGRAPAGTPPAGLATDLLGSLAAVLPAARAERDLAGVVLISDGADTEALAALERGQGLPEAVAEKLAAARVPVNTVAVGGGQDMADLAISRVSVDAFAFIRNAVEVEVELLSHGLPTLSAPVSLEQGGRLLTSRTLRLEPGRARSVKLKVVPDRVGDFVFRVSVAVQPGEVLTANNERNFVLRVIRDKIRVLHLVGRPSWDQRFLREVLKRNPNVDLISFFILRTLNDQTGVGQDELSLIPFPVAELFGKELPTFDLIIFQNFNHGPYQVSMYLPAIRDYVLGGGGLLMLGGDLSFASGGYAGGPVEDVLPVRLSAGDDRRSEVFRALLSPAGGRHPVMELGEAGVFEKLPPLGSYHRVSSLAPGASALLVHPFDQAIDGPAPVLALREVGRGRSAALLSDGAWRWSFVHSGQGGDGRTYTKLVNNLIRWLTRDPAMDPLQLESASSRYNPGEAVRLAAHVFERAPDSRAWLSLLRPDGQEVLERRSLELDESGRARAEFEQLEPGAYLARLEVEGAGAVDEAFVIEGAGKELSRPQPRPDLLELIAGATGGRSWRLDDARLDELAVSEPERFRIESSLTQPLIHHAWVLAWLVACWSLEWFLRRRWGFA